VAGDYQKVIMKLYKYYCFINIKTGLVIEENLQEYELLDILSDKKPDS
jgi:hypothetical protein